VKEEVVEEEDEAPQSPMKKSWFSASSGDGQQDGMTIIDEAISAIGCVFAVLACVFPYITWSESGRVFFSVTSFQVTRSLSLLFPLIFLVQ
jgi:hypothetical protein